MRWQKLDSARQMQAPAVKTCMGHRVVGHGTCSSVACQHTCYICRKATQTERGSAPAINLRLQKQQFATQAQAALRSTSGRTCRAAASARPKLPVSKRPSSCALHTTSYITAGLATHISTGHYGVPVSAVRLPAGCLLRCKQAGDHHLPAADISQCCA